ncbi:MAG: hypothetical protein VXA66_07805 [Alphaproteobacteria bacterium]
MAEPIIDKNSPTRRAPSPCMRSTAFHSAQLCRDCDCSTVSTAYLCRDVNGVVIASYRDLVAHGRHPDEAIRAALVVLRIHHPSLCQCNMKLIRKWLSNQAQA